MSRIRANQITNQSADGAPTVQNGLVISGVTTSTTFSGSGASLTNLPAAQLSGTAAAINGSNITNLNASNIASGTVPTARLGSGTANSSTFLAGDSTFKTVTGTTINNNADNRVITGSGTANTLEGESQLLFTGTNLGVGNRTSSPDERLHVHTSSGQANIHVEGATDGQIILRSHGGDSVIHFGDASATSVGKIQYDHGSDELRIHTNSSERLRIDSSGNLMVNRSSSAKRFSVKETSTSSGVYYNAHIGGASHLSNYAVGIGFDPEGYSARTKIGIVAEGINAGYSRGKLHFLLDSANDSGEATLSESRMTINDTGQVTTPFQPSFYATANSGGTVSMTSTHTFTNWRLSTSGRTYDVGNNFNTSNGRFTAPVTGKYLFTGSILLSGYDQACGFHVMWRKNGSTYQYWYNTRTSDIDRSGYGGYLAQGSTTTFTLNANDYVDVACNFSGSLKLWCGDANWGHWSGHFLG